ncbi:TIGR01777 family protein [Empedobacter stercoris]|uniref:TIGR01777 family protein n=1 Tax=Empedobacter stercoris TaxID=1628248 RepID=A0ABX1WPF8_9FLAO|nr:TIGR01777 family oxidoreductase [Empedobacter stercoris]MCA4809406.1 TIGR01777 family protein [Empedobacter stercoris]NOJ76435.1 TIGR01777 family protein [Empedobacter stercoris]QNT14548.1 TIGR01777 family protein [Empedobacter stercoris]
MNILLTGGSGLIGSELVKILIEKGHQVRILTREKNVEHPFYHWDKNKIDEKVFDNLDGIIHLAGCLIAKRWTKRYKEEILSSRVDTANLLFEYVNKLDVNLKFFISASGSAYYGQITSDKIFKESDEPNTDFLAKVCVAWENAAYQFEEIGARVVCLRTALVLAKNGEGFKLLKKPIQLGVGANLGDGKQWMPWIHIEDLLQIYAQAVENENIKGSFNASAPEHSDHSTFNRTLAKKLNKPFFLPNIPGFVMRLTLGEMSDLVLKGSRIDANKIEETGFTFQFPTLEKAFKDLV